MSRSEQPALDSAESLRAIFDTAGVGMTLVDAVTGRFLRVNPAYCAITGRTEAELLQLTISDLTHPDDRMQDQQYFARLARGELVSYTGEKRHLRPDGGVTWVQVHSNPIRDTTGRVVQVAAVIQNVTERKRAEEALRTGEERLRLATQSAGLGVFEYDIVRDRALWTPELYAMLGIPAKTPVTAAEFIKHLHPEDRPRFIRAAARSRDPRGSETFVQEYRICRADTGETRWVATSSRIFFAGDQKMRRAVRVIGMLMDITEKKTREGHDRFLSKLVEAWATVRDVKTFMQVTADAIARHLSVDLVTLGDITPDATVAIAELTHAFGRPTVNGNTYPVETYFTEEVGADLVAGQPVVVNDVIADPRTASAGESYRAVGVRTTVIVPILSDKELKATLNVSASGGRKWRLDEVQLLEDVAVRLWPVVERARAEEALRLSEERHEFLLRLSDALGPLTDPFEIEETAVRMLGEHLHANRVTYADIEGKEFFIRRSYTNNAAPFAKRGSIKTFGRVLLEAYKRGEVVAVSDVEADPRLTERERTNLRARNITSYIGVVMQKHGRPEAAFSVHSRVPRVWTRREIEFTRLVAERAWNTTQRARTEAALREREKRLELALEGSAAGVWTWDPGTNALDWDDRVHAHYGFAADDPRTFAARFARVHHEDREALLNRLEKMLQNNDDDEWDMTFRIVKPDGREAWIHDLGRAERDPDGRLTRVTGICLDITERRRAEEALRAQRDEERDHTLELLLEAAAQGILSVDERGVIVTANRALETMFGWGPGELIGQSVDQLVPTVLRDRHMIHRADYFEAPQARPMGDTGLGLTGQRRDGSLFPVEVSLNHAVTLKGAHAIAFVTDITARKQAEEALRFSHAALEERTAELERRTVQLRRLASELTLAEQRTREALAKTLHDGLQQLLVSAAMRLQLAKRGEALGPRESEMFAQAQTNINDAIAASRSLSIELFPPALHMSGLPAAVAWLAESMHSKYGLIVETSIDPLANSDRKDVRTLVFESLRELLFNAVKHAQVHRVAVDLALGANNALCVTVTDQGVGFDPAELFDPANTPKGGLGLFSIRERLTLLGGHLDVESAPGKGTRFRLVAPRDGEPRTGADAKAAAEKPLRIVITDDHAAVRESLREMLSEHPEFEVVGDASTGIEAISQARTLRPDVIVMDISMPEMDGVEATRRIHAELPSIRIFGLSSHERTAYLHPIEQVGGSGYFIKGGEMQYLIDRMLSLRQ